MSCTRSRGQVRRRQLVVGLALSLAAGCRDDLTRPAAGEPATTDLDPGESWSVSLPSEPLRGKGTSSALIATFPTLTAVSITASGTLTRTPNYSGIGSATQYGPFGNTSIAVAGQVTVVNGNPTYARVTGAWNLSQRDGYTPREFYGWPTGVYCGPMYGNRCDDYSGITTITVTRLPADLSVSVDSTTVDYGYPATFDFRATPQTLADGLSTPFVVDSTHWEPDAPNAGDTTVHFGQDGVCEYTYRPACKRRVYSSGTWTMSAWANGKRVTKSLHVNVRGPELVVNCTSTVERGQTVTCLGTLVPAGPFLLKWQEASAKKFNLVDTVGSSYSSGQTHSWSGTAVASTKVRMFAELPGGRLVNGKAGFEVTDRTWSAFSNAAPPDSAAGFQPGTPATTLRRPGDLRLATYHVKDILPGMISAGRPNAGPNRGLTYLTGRPSTPGAEVFIHPDLYPGTPFYNHQTGPLPKCRPADMVTLWAEVRRHEGLTMHPDSSHWGLTNKAYVDLRPERILEKLYSPDSTTGNFEYEVGTRFGKWRDGPHHSRQSAFEKPDYSIIFQTKLGDCVLDRS